MGKAVKKSEFETRELFGHREYVNSQLRQWPRQNALAATTLLHIRSRGPWTSSS